MTQKQLDQRDWKAILRARTNSDGTPKPGYKRNVEAIRQVIGEGSVIGRPTAAISGTIRSVEA